MKAIKSLLIAIVLLASVNMNPIFAQPIPGAPNILLIMSDDHSERAIGAYGSRLIQTPNIDRLAEEGTLFENSFVTNSICAPSRAVILTGKYSHRNGLRDNRDIFDNSQTTFPQILRSAGYQTLLIGKWHLKSEPVGFDVARILRGQGQYYNPILIEKGDTNIYTGYTTNIITDIALEEMNKVTSHQPFCMLVNYNAPHRNWMPDTKHLGKFDGAEIPLPPSFYDNYHNRIAAEEADMRIDDMYLSFDMKLHKEYYAEETGSGGNIEYAKNIEDNWIRTYNRLTEEQKAEWDQYYDKINREFKENNYSGDELLEWKYQRYMKDYLSCILSIDDNIGRILDYLDVTGLSENTLVIYTSDQGFYLGEHGWYDKRFMYEESMGMPLLMRLPGVIPAGKVTAEMVLNLDLAPTLLELAGIDIPAEMQGESFVGLLNEDNTGWRTSVYYHYYEFPHGWHNVRKHYGIRTDRYKLIKFYGDKEFWELYDLETDPDEMNNIYPDTENSALAERLKKELSGLQIKYGDTDPEE